MKQERRGWLTPWTFSGLLLALVVALGCGTDDPSVLDFGDDEPGRLRVVYAGDVGTEHAASFHRFLSRHFEVRSLPIGDLARVDLSPADVLVIDGEVGEVIDEAERRLTRRSAPRNITLETLDLPTVLIGGRGAQVADNSNLKLGWRYG